jgi:hypothetical protein
MQGAQELRSEAHLQVRRNDEVEAQRSRWTFYETIKISRGSSEGRKPPKEGVCFNVFDFLLLKT